MVVPSMGTYPVTLLEGANITAPDIVDSLVLMSPSVPGRNNGDICHTPCFKEASLEQLWYAGTVIVRCINTWYVK